MVDGREKVDAAVEMERRPFDRRKVEPGFCQNINDPVTKPRVQITNDKDGFLGRDPGCAPVGHKLYRLDAI